MMRVGAEGRGGSGAAAICLAGKVRLRQAICCPKIKRAKSRARHPVVVAMRPIRVLIADDQRIFRATLRRLLATAPDVVVVGDAADGQQAVSMAAEFCPDVVLMDIAMPVLNGIEATRRILRLCPRTRIIGVSIYDTSGMEEMMRAAGAVAYVAKGPELDELLETVQSVAP